MPDIRSLGPAINTALRSVVQPTSPVALQEQTRAFQQELRRLGVTKPTVTPTPTPAGLFPAPSWSQDHATYEVPVAQQIPKVALIGRRLFNTIGGNIDVVEGETAEGAGSYIRLSYTDLDENVDPLDDANWVHGAYVISNNHPASLVLAGYMIALPDGRLYITNSTFTDGSIQNMAGYGSILQNPLEPRENWVFGPWSYIGEGFVHKPYYHGSELRQIVDRQRLGSETFNPAVHKMRYKRLIVNDNAVVSEDLSVVPYAPIPDAEKKNSETSCAQIGGAKVAVSMRTGLGPYMAVSEDGGDTWNTPFAMPQTNVMSKACLYTSPSGNVIWVYNKALGTPGGSVATNRKDMTIAIWKEDDLTQPPALEWTFDTRGGQVLDRRFISYPDVEFIRNKDGSYSGRLVIIYDQGRGYDDPSTGEHMNYIWLQEMNEFDLLDGNLTKTEYSLLV